MFQPTHDVAVDTLVAEEIYEFGGTVFIGPEILTWIYGFGFIVPVISNGNEGDRGGTWVRRVGEVGLQYYLRGRECQLRSKLPFEPLLRLSFLVL